MVPVVDQNVGRVAYVVEALAIVPLVAQKFVAVRLVVEALTVENPVKKGVVVPVMGEEDTTVALRAVPVRVPAAAVTVMSAEPLKLTPLMFLAVCKVVAVEALPVKAAVIAPAVKLPEASRATMVEAVLALVALVAMVIAVEPL
ncbi:MAG: hypothetical protein UV39_C0025G0006 [Candidatus Azambacteria bacterium GW2011_GWA2_42_62]|nr:MAG: hypothetical protein UV39_C0025G0006 [Candidatus Azambacteria bacterium GW2011_GWA2_42_62]